MVSGLGTAGMSTVRIFNVTIGGNWALPFQSSNRNHKSSKHSPRSQKPPTPLGTISNHGIDANRGWTFAQAENLGLTFTTGKQC